MRTSKLAKKKKNKNILIPLHKVDDLMDQS